MPNLGMLVFYIYDQFFLQIVTSKVVKITKNGMSNSKGIILNKIQIFFTRTALFYRKHVSM